MTSDWILDHGSAHTLNQARTRWIRSEQDPETLIAERELTGLVHYVCNCGASTGWVPRETVPSPGDWHELHMSDLDRARWGFGDA